MSDELEPMSPAARALFDEVRGYEDPSGADRARVKQALVTAMASGAAIATGGAASGAAASGAAVATSGAAGGAAVVGGLSLGAKIGAAAVLAAAVAGTTFAVTQSAPEPVSHRTVSAPVTGQPQPLPAPGASPSATPQLVEAPAADQRGVEEAAGQPAPPAEEAATPGPSTRAADARWRERRDRAVADSTLTQEIVLIREAQRALAAGRAGDALEHLEQHARRFPGGILEEERDAARVVALCEAGETDRANALAREFLNRRPNSPHRARVQAACAD